MPNRAKTYGSRWALPKLAYQTAYERWLNGRIKTRPRPAPGLTDTEIAHAEAEAVANVLAARSHPQITGAVRSHPNVFIRKTAGRLLGLRS